MQRNARQRSEDTKASETSVQDSPAIQNLIEKLDRDLEETQRNASKAR